MTRGGPTDPSTGPARPLREQMYLVEGAAGGFTSIPTSVYWAIVTLTTVGHGDIAPLTAMGQGLAAVIMLLAFAIIAVPTGIVTVEIGAAQRKAAAERECPRCGLDDHDFDARYCKQCGERIPSLDLETT